MKLIRGDVHRGGVARMKQKTFHPGYKSKVNRHPLEF